MGWTYHSIWDYDNGEEDQAIVSAECAVKRRSDSICSIDIPKEGENVETNPTDKTTAAPVLRRNMSGK